VDRLVDLTLAGIRPQPEMRKPSVDPPVAGRRANAPPDSGGRPPSS
jgi:hypothetical protein